MRPSHGVVTAFMAAVLTLADSSALAIERSLGPVIPIPWFYIPPDLVVDDVAVTVIKCSSYSATVNIDVTVRNAGYKGAVMPLPGSPWVRVMLSGAWGPKDFGTSFGISSGKTQTFSLQNAPVSVIKDPFSSFASTVISVQVDPTNKVVEYNKANNKVDKLVLFPKTKCP